MLERISPGAGLGRRLAAEAVGSGLLLAAVVGSGIMAERLSSGNAAVALLANSLATGTALVALILAFGPVSGAHFNPLVSAAMAARRDLRWRDVGPYAAAQSLGALLGVAAAHVMFDLPILTASRHARTGPALWAGEGVATFGLVLIILACSRSRPSAVPVAVGAYITSAYWFTSSTSFANPVVTLARSFTDTFSGIRPADAPGFIVAQAAGAALATALGNWLPNLPRNAEAP